MKIKKSILSILSMIIIVSFALVGSVYATTPVPEASDSLQFVSIKYGNDNYTKKYGTEYQYSIFNPGTSDSTAKAIVINRIGQKENGTLKRIYDAYCARADQGFENRTSFATGEDIHTDTYPNRIDMNNESNLAQIRQVLATTDTAIGSTTSYKAILQLCDMFFTDEDDFENYKATTLKNALNSPDGYIEADPYEYTTEFLNEDEVKAIQQAALWYFTNYDQPGKFNLTEENASWLFRKTEYGYSEISDARSAEIDKESQALYNYLIHTAIKNAQNNVATSTNIYLYTNMNDRPNTQPIIIIQRENKEFDLALRKYISSVTTNGTTTNYSALGERMSNVDSTDLASNESTTATYKHRKDPVIVEKGSKVNYRLVIYNEGEIDGRATIIKDRLPNGVILVSSGDITSSTGNVYTISSNGNEVTLTMKNTSTTDIPAYTTGTPANEVIEIQCEVTAEPDEDNNQVLTNIAWIAEHASNKGIYTDRDSNNSTATNRGSTTPTIPSSLVTTDKGYTNGDNNDLTDKDHYFEGQEDDDDFEKIIIKAVKGSYNIILVKEDKDGEQLNDTATFEVDGVTKTVTGRLTIVENKKINASNVGIVDTYTIKETVPPDEYCAFDGKIKIEVYKKKNGEKYEVDKIKYYVDNVEVTSNHEDLNVYLNTDGNIYVEVKDYQFDLALRKFITKINDIKVEERATASGEETTEKNRTPVITGSSISGEETTAEKTHPKDKVTVAKGDRVLYTIRIYNEGEIDGTATQVTDFLPTGLDYIEAGTGIGQSKINQENGWSYDSATRKVTTNKLSGETILAVNKQWSKLEEKDINENPKYYRDVQIECMVNSTATSSTLRNVAEITGTKDTKGRTNLPEPDSTPNNLKDNEKTNPERPTSTKGKGWEDDDDFENLTLEFDIALRKYITKVEDEEGKTISISTRTPEVDEWNLHKEDKDFNRDGFVNQADVTLLQQYISKWDLGLTEEEKENLDVNGDGEINMKDLDTLQKYISWLTTATYKHRKDPVAVKTGYYVYYTLSIYNEGDADGNAIQVKDQLPAGLVAQTDSIVSDKFELENYDTTNNIITFKRKANQSVQKAYEKGKLVQNSETITIKSLVESEEENKILTNIAWISKYYNGDEAKEVEEDRDSEASNPLTTMPSKDDLVTENVGYTGKETITTKEGLADSTKYYKGQEDDDDFEKIIIADVPTIHKGVKTVENQDSGYDKNEKHTWVINSTIPQSIVDYDKYTIKDDIDYRLTFAEEEPVEVKIIKANKEVVKPLVKDTDYKITYTPHSPAVDSTILNAKSSGSLVITFIGNDISNEVKNNAGYIVEVKFKTTFAVDANGKLLAELGTNIPNKARLEYTNGSIDTEEPEVHTGGVTLYKYAAKNNEKVALEGAEFKIYSSRANAENKTNELLTATSGSNGVVEFIGLKYGGDASSSEANKKSDGTYIQGTAENRVIPGTTYYIVETKAPKNYRPYNGIIEVEINATSYQKELAAIKYQIENTPKDFDLALRKFITKVETKASNYTQATEYNEEENRVPKITGEAVSIPTPMVEIVGTGAYVENTTAQKRHTKDPVSVAKGDKVTYTIRVYNEGEVDGYAAEVTDYLPLGLSLVPKTQSTINTTYNWVAGTDANGKAVITSTYLKDNNKLLTAANYDFTKLTSPGYYEDLLVECIVNENATKNNLKNIAAITEYEDEEGNKVTDKDSEDEPVNPDDYNPKNPTDGIGEQDDDDFEDLKLEELDLALRKFITRVADNPEMEDATEYRREPETKNLKAL